MGWRRSRCAPTCPAGLLARGRWSRWMKRKSADERAMPTIQQLVRKGRSSPRSGRRALPEGLFPAAWRLHAGLHDDPEEAELRSARSPGSGSPPGSRSRSTSRASATTSRSTRSCSSAAAASATCPASATRSSGHARHRGRPRPQRRVRATEPRRAASNDAAQGPCRTPRSPRPVYQTRS